MLVYEVNIEVGPDVLADVEAWLPGHVQEVLRVSGFEGGTIYRHADNDNAFCVRYQVTTMAELDTYLNIQAPRLRSEAELKFPVGYKTWRRILKEEQILDPEIE